MMYLSRAYLQLLSFTVLLLGLLPMQAQPCLSPTNLKVRNITHFSAQVYWSGGSGSGSFVFSGQPGATPPAGAGLFVKGDSVNWSLSVAVPGHTYYIYVRDSCGPNSYSSWTGPVVFKARAYPKFSNPQFQIIPSRAKVLAVGDLNNDFRNDVVIGTPYSNDTNNSNRLLVYHQTSRGTVGNIPFRYRVGEDTLRSIDVGYLNHDLLTDVIVGYGDSVAIFLQKNNGRLQLDTSLYSGKGVYDVITADINGDSLTDFAAYNSRENSVRVFYQDPSAHFNSIAKAVTTSKRGELEVGDLNSDGWPDLVVMTSEPPRVSILEGGAGSSLSMGPILQSPDTGSYILKGLRWDGCKVMTVIM
ncbi:MAG: FG-GAP-like repeat-containing protein [Owenweeksia sp.]|nr:FG-GAP-like repeat-containing protein [Owenweeksia sp.]